MNLHHGAICAEDNRQRVFLLQDFTADNFG